MALCDRSPYARPCRPVTPGGTATTVPSPVNVGSVRAVATGRSRPVPPDPTRSVRCVT